MAMAQQRPGSVRNLALHSYAKCEETATEAAALINGKSRMLHLQRPGD